MRWMLATMLGLLLACGIPAALAQSSVAEGDTQARREHVGASVAAGTSVSSDKLHGNVDLRLGGLRCVVRVPAVHVPLQSSPPAPAQIGSVGLAAGSLNALRRIATPAGTATDHLPDASDNDGEEPDKWAQASTGMPAASVLLEGRRGDTFAIWRAVFLEVRERPPQ